GPPRGAAVPAADLDQPESHGVVEPERHGLSRPNILAVRPHPAPNSRLLRGAAGRANERTPQRSSGRQLTRRTSRRAAAAASVASYASRFFFIRRISSSQPFFFRMRLNWLR